MNHIKDMGDTIESRGISVYIACKEDNDNGPPKIKKRLSSIWIRDEGRTNILLNDT